MHDYVVLYNSVCTSVATWFLCVDMARFKTKKCYFSNSELVSVVTAHAR